MNPGGELTLVCRLSRRLPWAYKKALVKYVATAGDWNGASALADGLEIHPEDQRLIYLETYGHNPTTITITTPGPPSRIQPTEMRETA